MILPYHSTRPTERTTVVDTIKVTIMSAVTRATQETRAEQE